MPNLFSLKKQRADALNTVTAITTLAESVKRPFTADEERTMSICMSAIDAINPQLQALEKNNTLAGVFARVGGAALLGGGQPGHTETTSLKAPQRLLSADYLESFYAYIASKGSRVDAALYEGSDGAGGYAVPIVVSDQIVPLAPNEMAVRQAAAVIPTSSDILVPQKGSFGTASTKAENAAFTESDPTLTQFKLSAYMHGNMETLSWELAQDVPAFQQFCVQDLILGTQMLEENLYVNGTGSGQPQGLIGNVGAGVTLDPDSNGNLVGISGLLDLTGTLNAIYHANASFLMNRTTSILIRKAQVTANLFEQVFTRGADGVDRLFGYPVRYSASLPTAARGVSGAVLFGDFKQGYIIGDRGGSGINVKVLDQPLATQGQIVLLAYRRTDGRVRRSEAIQQYNITASGTSAPE